jgi:hypothetical protein
MLRTKIVFSILLFLLIINFWITPVFTQNQPGSSNQYKDWVIKIELDSVIQDAIIKDPRLIPWSWDIRNGLYNIIKNQVLPEYAARKSKLPGCVQEAMDNLLSKKIIKIVFTLGGSEPDPYEHKGNEGGEGSYNEYKDRISIHNVYQSVYDKIYCTKALIFHEMMHQALHHASMNKDLKEKFCVKIEGTEEINCFDPKTGEKYKYPAKRCTNRENMDEDEAIAEDCELKIFSCGPDGYRDYAPGYKSSGAREFNPPKKEDCSEELCKKDGEECNDECTNKEDCPQKPPDHQDDNFSFSTGIEVNEYKLAPEALIYKGGFYHEAVNLFGGLLWDGENSAEELLKASKVLIIPSGGLYNHENDSTLKNILEEYVRRGGSLLILCQQYGSNFSLIPRNAEEPLKAYGWRESQSCTWGSLYFKKEGIHPVHSALTGEKASSAVDGYFPVYPSNSTILLRRMANNEPALLYYPYGAGFLCNTRIGAHRTARPRLRN